MLGQGVLEVKKADWSGVLVLHPDLFDDELLEAFAPLSDSARTWDLSEISGTDRAKFDRAYLEAIGAGSDDAMQLVALAVTSSSSERHFRAESVRDQQAQRRSQRRVATSIDAYAARIAAHMPPFPDPRDQVESGVPTRAVLVAQPIGADLSIGEDLFTTGQVLADGEPVATPGDLESARFVLSVLLHDPELNEIDVPTEAQLAQAISKWEDAIEEWTATFDATAKSVLAGVTSPRVQSAIIYRAATLLHAPAALEQ